MTDWIFSEGELRARLDELALTPAALSPLGDLPDARLSADTEPDRSLTVPLTCLARPTLRLTVLEYDAAPRTFLTGPDGKAFYLHMTSQNDGQPIRHGLTGPIAPADIHGLCRDRLLSPAKPKRVDIALRLTSNGLAAVAALVDLLRERIMAQHDPANLEFAGPFHRQDLRRQLARQDASPDWRCLVLRLRFLAREPLPSGDAALTEGLRELADLGLQTGRRASYRIAPELAQFCAVIGYPGPFIAAGHSGQAGEPSLNFAYLRGRDTLWRWFADGDGYVLSDLDARSLETDLHELGLPGKKQEPRAMRKTARTSPVRPAKNVSRFCTSCGTPLKSTTKFCTACGEPVGEDRAE